ncbi:MAG TPA: FAD-binding oxidoreductase [Saprospiraceae bacterium]|nr:FAD-binding oxidoreductase [Saprospiraceae bacterium]
MMNLSAGYPYWLIKTGLPYTYPKLDKSVSSEVVIIGGGISGSLMAYYLAQEGIDSILVDSRTIGLGSTSASTALLQYEIDVPLHKLSEIIGKKKATRSYNLCLESINIIASIAEKLNFHEFEYKKSLYYACFKRDIPYIQNEYTARKRNGFNVQFLDSVDIKKNYNFKSPLAILSKDGAQLNPYSFTHALLQYCITKATRVFDRTLISKIEHKKEYVHLETEDGHKIKTRHLIYANGYEVVKYIDKKIVDLHSTYAIVSEQFNYDVKFWKDNAMIWNTADPYLYIRTTLDGRILIGGRDEPFYNPGKRDKLIKTKAQQLKLDFQRLFPHIPFKTELSWTGTFGATQDGLPFIGPYKNLPNSYFALGFGGNGICFSVIAAEIIRDIITGKKNKDLDIFSFDRI